MIMQQNYKGISSLDLWMPQSKNIGTYIKKGRRDKRAVDYTGKMYHYTFDIIVWSFLKGGIGKDIIKEVVAKS